MRKLFRDNMPDYQAKAEAVRNAEVYKDAFAISECPSEGLTSPTVIGAQAANDLLNINNIRASIVLTQYNGTIFVSARSIDDINVQVMICLLYTSGFGTGPTKQFVTRLMGTKIYGGFVTRFVIMNLLLTIGLIMLLAYVKRIRHKSSFPSDVYKRRSYERSKDQSHFYRSRNAELWSCHFLGRHRIPRLSHGNRSRRCVLCMAQYFRRSSGKYL